MAVVMKACIVWLVLVLGIASAWSSETLRFDAVPTSASVLSVRDDTPKFSPSRGCKAVCKASGCQGCNSKRSLSWPIGNFHTGDADNATQSVQLSKRVLAPVSAANADRYVSNLANGPGVESIVATNSVGSISFSVQEMFANHPGPTPLLVGVRQSFLTGCTILTVVSKRAVYMAHFYQDLGFENEEPEEGDPPVNFQGTVLDLIAGTLAGTPDQVNAGGPGIDPALFNADGDMPYANIMVPRHNNRGKSEYYRTMNKQIADLVHRLIPRCRIDKYKYFSEEDYPDDSARGVAIFEYDADADGNGHGDWRLWYETSVQRGRELGQDVIPSAGS